MIYFKQFVDLLVTLIDWVYFSLSIVLLFALFPLFLLLSLFYKNREILFQNIVHYYLRSFFFVLKLIVPRLNIYIHNLQEIKNIRSSIVISNHISYLDPLLILSTNKRLVTILRGKHIRIPAFGWLLNKAGYIPIAGEGKDDVDTLFIERVSKISELFLKGQNILIFPEGTRSRNGNLGEFKKQAFKLAKKYNVPLELLLIKNTDVLFKKGKFLYNTCIKNKIELKKIGRVVPDHQHGTAAVKELMDNIYRIYLDETGRKNHSEKETGPVVTFYNDLADDYDKEQDSSAFAFVREPEKEIILNNLKKVLKKEFSVLEIGAGTGRFTLEIAPYVKKVVAVDISENMLGKLSEKLREKNISNVTLINGNFLRVDFSEKFDVIASFSAIEYIKDAAALYKKIGALAGPECKLIITTAHNTFLRLFGRLGNYFRQKIYMKAYRKNEMKKLLEENGFEIENMTDICLKNTFIRGILLFVLANKKQ